MNKFQSRTPVVVRGSVGCGSTGVRDFGLFLASLSVVFFGRDRWSVDSRI
ncbi:hypothetical protein IT398_02080 [Candidatus Nomurabacteria bacterium]|nr:hypothetical protein [Candidatus Nomurabacteria bacterium]